MKTNYFGLCCILLLTAFVSCNNTKNEPDSMAIVDGKATIKLASPSLASNVSSTTARKINGSISGNNIVFSWNANNVIEFVFYKGNEKIGTQEYTVTSEDISSISSGIMTIEVPVPEGADKFDVACGPSEIPKKQYYYNGIADGTMRFEKNGCTFTSDVVEMKAIWSALIIVPAMQFTYDAMIASAMLYCSADYGYTKMTVQQTINSVAQPQIVYRAKDIFGDECAVTLSAMGGQQDIATPYIVVVNPATSCSLDISIEYDPLYFTGRVSQGTKTYYTLAPHDVSNITTKSMHADAIPTLEAGKAYEIEALKSHPLTVQWDATKIN